MMCGIKLPIDNQLSMSQFLRRTVHLGWVVAAAANARFAANVYDHLRVLFTPPPQKLIFGGFQQLVPQ
jgi:hypothetical protein